MESVLQNIRAWWAWLLSYRKCDWEINDYPVRLREQPAPISPESRYYAQIINWWSITGLGLTPEAARENLAVTFSNYKAKKGNVPRPGTRGPIEFACSERYERCYEENKELVTEFFNKVLDLYPEDCFLSDESSLFDFAVGPDDPVEALLEKTNIAFSLSLTKDDDLAIVAILEKIKETRKT